MKHPSHFELDTGVEQSLESLLKDPVPGSGLVPDDREITEPGSWPLSQAPIYACSIRALTSEHLVKQAKGFHHGCFDGSVVPAGDLRVLGYTQLSRASSIVMCYLQLELNLRRQARRAVTMESCIEICRRAGSWSVNAIEHIAFPNQHIDGARRTKV